MKFLIISNDLSILSWKNIHNRVEGIEKMINTGKNVSATVGIQNIDTNPVPNGNRLNHGWLANLFKPYFNQGYDICGFHMSMKEWKRLGLKPSRRGSNPIDKTEQEEFYFRSDEYTMRGDYLQFEEVFGHELAHSYFQETGLPDITHEWHEKHGTIRGIFATFDWNLYQPKRFNLKKQVNLLQRIVSLYKQLTTPTRTLYPLFDKTIRLSQSYGLANSEWYPLTGHHIGTDYATPVGTPIYAPTDCEVTRVGYAKTSIGHWCEVKIDNWYMILCHLNHAPDSGKQKKGDLIGYTGNTGFTKGAHCHVEAWHQPMDRSKLSKATWDKLTFDVTTKFK